MRTRVQKVGVLEGFVSILEPVGSGISAFFKYVHLHYSPNVPPRLRNPKKPISTYTSYYKHITPFLTTYPLSLPLVMHAITFLILQDLCHTPMLKRLFIAWAGPLAPHNEQTDPESRIRMKESLPNITTYLKYGRENVLNNIQSERSPYIATQCPLTNVL